jgi:hypothetical protein
MSNKSTIALLEELKDIGRIDSPSPLAESPDSVEGLGSAFENIRKALDQLSSNFTQLHEAVENFKSVLDEAVEIQESSDEEDDEVEAEEGEEDE